jgi:MULE transposase domain
MLSSNGMTDTIEFFLNWVKETSPIVWPAVIMSDHDQVQLNALKKVYPDSQILLCICIWHVLCAFQSHFVAERFQALWAKVKSWVKTKDSDEFDKIWTEIASDQSVPQSLIDYFNKDWIPYQHMWSLSYRNECSILEEGDTNMLIEA